MNRTLLNCEHVRYDFIDTLRARTQNQAYLIEAGSSGFQIEFANNFIMPNDKTMRCKVLEVINAYESERLKRFELDFDQVFTYLDREELRTIVEYFEDFMSEQYECFLRERSSFSVVNYEFGKSDSGGCLLVIYGCSNRVCELRDEAVFAEIKRIESVYFGKFDLLTLADGSNGKFSIYYCLLLKN